MANNTIPSSLSNSNVNPNQNQENLITHTLSSQGLSHVSPPPHHSVNNNRLISQLGLSQRLSDLRKTARGMWIHDHTAHPSFSASTARNHSSWLGALGLADGPAQLSFSNESIGDYAAENLIRESKKIRSQLLQAASSSSSPGTNDDGKKKARDVFRAQLLLASPPRNNEISINSTVMIGSSASSTEMRTNAPSINDGIGIINNRIITTHLPLHNTNANYYDHKIPFLKAMSNFSHQNLISSSSSNPIIQYPSLTTIFNANLSSVGNFLQHNRNNNNNHPVTTENIVISSDDEADGRIRSLPYKKYGPYTCPRCNQVFFTSQSFAAHVGGSHYRYETKAQRKKRLMSRIRKRNLRLQMVNGHLTFVPVSSHQAQAQASGSTNTRFARTGVAPAPTVKVEEDQNQVAPPPPPPGMDQAHAHANGDVKIKSEPNV